MTIKSEMLRGYPALLAAFIGMGIGVNSLYFYTTGMFIKPLQAEFDWTRGAISSVSFVGAMASAAISPFVGALTDRFGIRMIGGICLLAFACGLYLLSGVAGFTEFFIVSLLILMFGVGTGPVVFSRLVNQHFNKSRGFALGLALAGTGLAGAFAPRFIAGYIEEYGWREGYRIMAVIVIVLTPLVLFLARKSLTLAKDSFGEETENTPTYGYTLTEAKRSSTLWLLGALFFFVSLAIGGLIMHLVPLLTDANVPLKKAASIAGVLGLSVVIGRIGIGLLLDRFFAPYIAIILFFISGLGLLLLAFGGSGFAIIAAICIGCSMGGETDLIAYFTAKYFGLRSYSKIYGVVFMMFMFGMSFSAVLTGLIYDTQGSYFIALVISAVFLFIACIISSRLPAYPSFNRE
jgi:MFS family permease